ncbi:TatD family hydrolase [Hydrogenophaga defluvii]|uniref:TatD family hydrolase n=1 Tax=Hydrogenophaga defluvii TaxID=249410 RepID=A0ABW2S7T6_9BURK
MWTDTHCHLDAPEFGGAATAERAKARAAGVDWCVYPAVVAAHFDAVRQLAHLTGDAYALGIHPLYVPQATEDDLTQLERVISEWRDDPRLVAVGEIGLDLFVPALCTPEMRDRQTHFYRAQLRIARRHGLPVILHVRRSADLLLKHLRQLPVIGGIAHAFNGSDVQAQAFVDRGFKLGFGGALTFDTARQLRHLATHLPLQALVLETDAPDIPPQWLYTPAAERAAGVPQGRNSPAELPRIGAVLAELRGLAPEAVARATSANACQALPRLATLVQGGH